jgi:hypothetical protein
MDFSRMTSVESSNRRGAGKPLLADAYRLFAIQIS